MNFGLYSIFCRAIFPGAVTKLPAFPNSNLQMWQTIKVFPAWQHACFSDQSKVGARNMIDFVICLGWGIACSYYLLLVKIGTKPTPRPPELASVSGRMI